MSAILETGSPSVPVSEAAPAARLGEEGMIAGLLAGDLRRDFLAMIERDVLLFVGLELGFVFASLMLAEPVLQLLPWWAVLGGNVIAAGVMLAYSRGGIRGS